MIAYWGWLKKSEVSYSQIQIKIQILRDVWRRGRLFIHKCKHISNLWNLTQFIVVPFQKHPHPHLIHHHLTHHDTVKYNLQDYCVNCELHKNLSFFIFGLICSLVKCCSWKLFHFQINESPSKRALNILCMRKCPAALY